MRQAISDEDDEDGSRISSRFDGIERIAQASDDFIGTFFHCSSLAGPMHPMQDPTVKAIWMKEQECVLQPLLARLVGWMGW